MYSGQEELQTLGQSHFVGPHLLGILFMGIPSEMDTVEKLLSKQCQLSHLTHEKSVKITQEIQRTSSGCGHGWLFAPLSHNPWGSSPSRTIFGLLIRG